MAQLLRDVLQETEDSINAGRVDEALTRCQSILAAFPQALEAQRVLGEIYLAQGRLEEALHSFDWVLTNDPENVMAYCDRAEVSERMADVDTALDCYQQAYELSRGNRQIRHEFNVLSAQAGQQGFMFSRAGLARLYMRGDLLSQAVQEWEQVLAQTPDRLDAQTGLLEVCWRLGWTQRVEQLAAQILQAVPGCLKALFLLAHVTYGKDPRRAQELIKQAEIMDPDLIMGQALFADLLARHSDDPFFLLLRKDPTALPRPASSPVLPDISSASGGDQLSIPGTHLTASAEALAQWGNIEGWSNDTTLIKPRSDQNLPGPSSADFMQVAGGAPFDQQASPFAEATRDSGVFSINSAADQGFSSDPWHMPDHGQESSSDPEPWQLLQDALQQMPVSQNEMLPSSFSDQSGTFALHTSSDNGQDGNDVFYQPAESGDSWSKSDLSRGESNGPSSLSGTESGGLSGFQFPSTNSEAASGSWPLPENKTVIPAPPAWLSMLTQSEPSPGQNLASSPEHFLTPGSDDERNSEKESSNLLAETHLADVTSEPLYASSSNEISWKEALSSDFSLDQSDPSEAFQPSQASTVSTPPVQPEEEAAFPWAADNQEEPVLSNEDDEESFFSPAWLRSLGATTIEDESTHMQTPISSTAQPLVEQNEPVNLAEVSPPVSMPPAVPQASTEIETGVSWLQQLERDHAQRSVRQPEVQNETPSSPFWQELQELQPQQPDLLATDDWQGFEKPTPALSGTDFLNWSGASESEDVSFMATTSQSQQIQNQQQDNASSFKISDTPDHSDWQNELSAPAHENSEDMPQNEQNMIKTLEEWEEQLRSKGFIPMEPKSLATFAQQLEPEQPEADIYPTAVGEDDSEFTVAATPEEQPFDQPSLSSAFAALGNSLSSFQAAKPVDSFSVENANEQPEDNSSEETDWAQIWAPVPQPIAPRLLEPQVAFNATPEPAPAMSQESEFQATVLPEPTLSAPVTKEPVQNNPSQQPGEESEKTPLASPTFTSAAPVADTRISSVDPTSSRELQETLKVPISPRANPFMEGGLEATMRRPAVRLQSMQRTTGSGYVSNGLLSRGRTTEQSSSERNTQQSQPSQQADRTERSENPTVIERSSASLNKMTESGTGGYKERLVKGYQYQLVGDYDAAMQEYRIIIRSAPELLNDVVSNVRALLKLAPKYSAGYRVLGDAYMRQGEYLQAMDSYNKALTMAKKARN